MVRPDDEAEDRDGKARKRDDAVAEHLLAREGGDELAHHAQGRENHDVDRRMRVEPEQVLEQHWVAAARRIEYAKAECALDEYHQHRDGNHRRADDLNESRCVMGPYV